MNKEEKYFLSFEVVLFSMEIGYYSQKFFQLSIFALSELYLAI